MDVFSTHSCRYSITCRLFQVMVSGIDTKIEAIVASRMTCDSLPSRGHNGQNLGIHFYSIIIKQNWLQVNKFCQSKCSKLTKLSNTCIPVFTLILKKCNHISTNIYRNLHIIYESYFPGSDTRSTHGRSWSGMLELLYDSIWGKWLTEISKFNQHHGRMLNWCCENNNAGCIVVVIIYTR